MRMDVIQGGLRVVPGDKDRASLAVGRVVVHGTSHDVFDHHAQGNVAVGDLHRRARAGHVPCLDAPRVIVGLIDVQELRQRPIGDHAIEISAEFLRAALIRDVEVISRIVVVQPRFAVGIVGAQHGQDRRRQEVGLPKPVHRRMSRPPCSLVDSSAGPLDGRRCRSADR